MYVCMYVGSKQASKQARKKEANNKMAERCAFFEQWSVVGLVFWIQNIIRYVRTYYLISLVAPTS